LIQAAQSGKLIEALRDATAKKAKADEVDAKHTEVESLRREARDTLLKAARDGRLASAFKEMRKADGGDAVELASNVAHSVVQQGIQFDVAKAVQDAQEISIEDFEDVEGFSEDEEESFEVSNEEQAPASVPEQEGFDAESAARLEARQTLIQAAQSGKLIEALRDATAKKAKADEVDAKHTEVESLRREARDTLLKAARDGRLASAFKEMRKAPDALEAEDSEAKHSEDSAVEEARNKARSALLNTLQTGDFAKAMAEIMEKRQEAKKSQRAPVEVPETTPIQWHQPLQESTVVHKMPRTKRRIIGGVVRAPSESVPVDPNPPTASPTSQLAWYMAGPVSNGLRKKDVATFQLDDGSDTENRGLARKSSITSMFEALGSAQLIRMDADDEPTHVPSMRLSASCSNLKPQGSTSAMALDLGLDLGAKDRIGTPSMGSRCSSVGSLRALKANKAKPLPFLQKPNSRADWSIGTAVPVMNKTPKEWSTMGTMAAF